MHSPSCGRYKEEKGMIFAPGKPGGKRRGGLTAEKRKVFDNLVALKQYFPVV